MRVTLGRMATALATAGRGGLDQQGEAELEELAQGGGLLCGDLRDVVPPEHDLAPPPPASASGQRPAGPEGQEEE